MNMGTLAEGFEDRAQRKLREAENYLESFDYAESISASQESMEFAAKAVFLLLQLEYPKRHDFKDDEFEALLRRVPEDIKYLNFPKLFLRYKFWQGFYTIAKYGDEKLNVSAGQLFGRQEAELALEHARSWDSALITLSSLGK